MIFLCPLVHLNPLKHLIGEQFEHSADVTIIFSAGFYEMKPVFFRECLRLFPWHLSILVKVSLRTNQDHIRVCIAHLLDLVDPRLNVIETHRVSDGVSENDAMRPLIKRFCDVSKPLLASCIPNVEGDLSLIEFYPLDLEVNSNRAQVIRLEGVFAVPN